MDPIEQTLVATQNLLCALEQDSSLLRDKKFMEKLIYLRSKHRETTDLLLKQTQYPNRNHISGATYHKSPGCTHYWSEVPIKLAYKSGSSDSYVKPGTNVAEKSIPIAEDSISFSKPIVQDAAEVINGLRSYRRILRIPRRHQEKIDSLQHLEGSSSYQPIPHTLRSIRQKTISLRAESNDQSPKSGLALQCFESQVVEEDDIPSRRLSVSTSDLRAKKNSSKNKANGRFEKEASKSEHDLRDPDLVKLGNRNQKSRPPSAPKITVPKPFAFMQRKYKGNTYARKFLEKMLDDKEKEARAKEEEEEKKLKPFKAHPIPLTTYKSDNPRVDDRRYVETVRKKLKANLKLQTTLIRSQSVGDVTSVTVRPIPASTYLAPDLYLYRRGRESSKRAIHLLTEARTPPGLKEHSVRTNVAFHLRHQHCKENSKEKKVRRQSIPDFKKIHREFNQQLQKIYSSKPPTVPIPFKLSESSKRRRQSISPPRMHSRRQSSFFEPVFPVHETHSSLLRTQSIRKRLEKEQSDKEKQVHARAEHEVEIGMQKQRLRRTISRSGERDVMKKTEERRRAMLETTRDYEAQLQDIKKRVMARPLVMEQQSTSAQQHALERKYKQALSVVSGVSRSMGNISKITDEETTTLLVPQARRLSGATGDTFSVKSKRSSIVSSQKSEKEDYNMDFDSDDEPTQSISKLSKSSVSKSSSNSSSSRSVSNRYSSKSS